jgi:hypothetical protein
MEATPQAMETLFNEAMLIERTQHLGVDAVNFLPIYPNPKIKTKKTHKPQLV